MLDKENKYTKRALDNNSQDKLLLGRFIKGDDTAFNDIYQKYTNELLSYGTGLGFDREVIKDAIHDIFYKLFSKKKYLENVTSLKAYLFRSLKNKLLNTSKSKNENLAADSAHQKFIVEVTVLDELITSEERKKVESEVESYLNCLTSRQREAVYLRFIQEMEYDEIGSLLDMSPHAARKLVSRGIIRMRNKNAFALLILASCFS